MLKTEPVLRLLNVRCPICSKGIITKVPHGTDMRKLIFYTQMEQIVKLRQVQVHKCHKCGSMVGLTINL